MRFLIVSRVFPMRDRNAGDLRFAQIIERLAVDHAITFCPTALEWQRDLVGADAVSRYRDALAASGARIIDHPVAEALRTEPFDAAFFEFHDVAAKYTPFVRYYQARCKVVVDSGRPPLRTDRTREPHHRHGPRRTTCTGRARGRTRDVPRR